MSRAYIYAELKSEMSIRRLRDRIFRAANAQTHYKRVKPHMTIVSPCRTKEGHEDQVKEVIKQSKLNNSKIEFESLSSYTSIEEPYVVSLDVQLQRAEERAKLVEQLEPHLERNSSKEFEPHVTLLKLLVPDEGVPQQIKDNIRHEVSHTLPPRSTEIDSLKCEIKG